MSLVLRSIVLCFVCTALFPCHAAEPLRIAALISDTSNPYWKAFEEGLRESARNGGVSIDIYALSRATDAEGQVNQCEAALLKKPRAILFAAVNGMNLSACLKKARQMSIVLIDVDGNVDQKLAEKMGVEVAFSVASNNYELGASAARYLRGSEGKVLVIEGLSGSQPSELRVRGFKENLSEGLTLVSSQPAEWDRLKGYEIASRVLLQHPDLGFIFAANDTMALGAVEALRTAGNRSVRVVGIDGSVDAVKSIKEGRLTATIAQLPYLMAKEAVEKANEFLRQETAHVPFQQYVPILTLDKEVLSHNNQPLMQYLR